MITKSVFKIAKMDCPSEEHMIRMKLEGFTGIKKLDFDIPNRTLEVFHDGKVAAFDAQIHGLNLGSTLERSEVTVDFEEPKEEVHQRKML